LAPEDVVGHGVQEDPIQKKLEEIQKENLDRMLILMERQGEISGELVRSLRGNVTVSR
jgi:hypothetical protein